MEARRLKSLLLLLGVLKFCSGQETSGEREPCDDFTDLDLSHCLVGTSLAVRLLLYTRLSPSCGRELRHQHLSAQPHLNLSRPTAFVIHGYRPTGAPPVWIDHIVRLLAEQRDMNVIVVDWNQGAANLNYFTAVTYTREAAHNLTAFILAMQEGGASLGSLHLIGVSLGAHLAGFVGANLKGRIGRITGLDPAGPMFTGAGPDDRLDPTDAELVDVLHTDMNSFGLRGQHGHIDFYANGGADQPGCPRSIFSGKSYFVCDHQRSVFLYLCALNRTCRLSGYPCASYSDFLDGRCLQCEAFRPASCPLLGYDLSEWKEVLLQLGQTKVFFSTTAAPPYRKLSYRVDMVTWNQYLRWGVVYIRLHSGKTFTEARVDHKRLRLEQYTSTRLLAQFDEDLQNVHKISMRIVTGNVIGPRYKIRLLRIRFTPLERPDRSVCPAAGGYTAPPTVPVLPPQAADVSLRHHRGGEHGGDLPPASLRAPLTSEVEGQTDHHCNLCAFLQQRPSARAA
ncbi:lipase member H isoform X1 [Synchiropus splendidus]|uniref:lipase member H isoform X1 n=1 Tax=Synchiropus splendidus TaxID=270530 RepID=UPI00237DBDBC|nr:lipase member H isoform X1 [Synchiropus splendidus]